MIDAGPPQASRLTLFPCVGFLISGASMLAVSLYVLSRLTESPPRPLGSGVVLVGATFGVGTILLFAVATLVSMASDRMRALARSGRIEFRELGIFITKADQRVGVKWVDVRGYLDDSPEFVQILTTRSSYPNHLLTIPTANEADRVRILTVLDEHGVRRVDD